VTAGAATPVVRLRGIAKSFGSAQALRGVDFSLLPAEIHALLGENGAGKTTLMRILFGLVRQDAGTIEVSGEPLRGGDPREAMHRGIGLVHQHFSQVPDMSVAENVSLGRPGFRYDRRGAAAAVVDVGRASGLMLDPAARAGDLPIGLRQRLEIVKALCQGARVLLLDEPTASLTPSEVTDLFAALRRLRDQGIAIVLITHKLREVQAIADRVTVLRQGQVIATGSAAAFTPQALAAAMIGEGVGAPADTPVLPRRDRAPGTVLEVRDLSVPGAAKPGRLVQGVSLDVMAGEIVGIAAVEGNGQRELMRAIAGFVPYEGSVTLKRSGEVGFVPEDRQGEGLILDFSIVENIALAERHGFWLPSRFLEDRAVVAIDEYGIRAPDPSLPARTLSGGNQQKLVLARVLAQKPALVVAENPTRGLDLRATTDVHAALRRAARDHGAGVLLYSTDLDEIITVAGRIGVMVNGRWTWVPDADRSRERIGAMMLGAA
jgi:ABC-type uncharacterized transport system ATPase subunit